MFPPTEITRRHLPHWRRDRAIYWVTFRLADSLPAEKLAGSSFWVGESYDRVVRAPGEYDRFLRYQASQKFWHLDPSNFSRKRSSGGAAAFLPPRQDDLVALPGFYTFGGRNAAAPSQDFRNDSYLRANPAKARLPADHFWLWPPGETCTPPETGMADCRASPSKPACPPNPTDIPTHPSNAPSTPQARMPVPPPPPPASSSA